MAVWYANANTGSSANSGATMALAKATLAQAMALTATGDTIVCTGVFREAIPVTRAVQWLGQGHCEFNGIPVSTAVTPLAGTVWRNIIFRQWIVCPFTAAGLTANNQFIDCKFTENLQGIDIGMASVFTSYVNCVFFNNVVGMYVSGINFPGAQVRNCVFYGNQVDVWYQGGTASSGNFNNCCFGSPMMVKSIAAFSPYGSVSDNNIYDFTNGKCSWNGTDKTTLAAWQAMLVSPRELNSIDRVWRADVGDYANRIFRSNPSSYLLTAAQGNPAGLILPGLTVSNNTNSSLWTGAVLTGMAIDSYGKASLTAGNLSGSIALDVIDLGANISGNSVELALNGETFPAFYSDFDTADSPGFLTLEVRGSTTLFAKTDSSPAWVTVPRSAELASYMSNNLRYWQIRVTLRSLF